jgi:hypothetical protein
MNLSGIKSILAAVIVVAVAATLTVCDSSSDDNGNPNYTPSDATEIILYVAGETVTLSGNLAGLSGDTLRDKVDCLCAAEKPSGVTSPNVRALISLSSDDEIADFPTLYGTPTDLPVEDPTGAYTIADDWADLLDGTIDITLWDAGITPVSWTVSLTGSDENGNYLSDYSCDGWTSSDSSSTISWGRAGATNYEWMSIETSSYCSANSNTRIMCITY